MDKYCIIAIRIGAKGNLGSRVPIRVAFFVHTSLAEDLLDQALLGHVDRANLIWSAVDTDSEKFFEFTFYM
jgi:hypothetical protein